MSIAKKILGNTMAQIAGRAVMAAVSVVILKAASNYLGVSGYGMYTAVYEYLAFFGIMADLGLFTISVREMGKGLRTREFIAGNILGIRMLLALTMLSLAVISVFLIPKYQGTYIPMGVAIASISVYLAILHGTISSVLQVEHKMQWSTLGLVGGKVISMAWMLAVIYYFFAGDPSQESFNQLMLAGIAGNLFAFLFTAYFALKLTRVRPRFDREYWIEIFKTSAPYGAALVFNMIYFKIASIMLLFMRGPEEVGLYGIPMRILEILSVIPVYFMNSVLPVLSRYIQEKSALVGRTIQLSFDFLFMSALPLVVGVFIFAYPIVFLISSPEFLSRLDEGFYGSDIALKILTISMALGYINSLFIYTLIAIGKQSALLWINGAAAFLSIFINFLVIPDYGFRGTAVSSIVIEIFILVSTYWFAKRHLRFELSLNVAFKCLIAVAIMAASVYYLKDPAYQFMNLQNFSVLLLGFLGAVIYALALFVLRAFPKEFKKIPEVPAAFSASDKSLE